MNARATADPTDMPAMLACESCVAGAATVVVGVVAVVIEGSGSEMGVDEGVSGYHEGRYVDQLAGISRRGLLTL